MPETIREWVPETGPFKGQRFAIERDTPKEVAARRLTFAQFCEAYGGVNWDKVREALAADSVDRFYLGFLLHVRVPNGHGFFGDGPGAEGAVWCKQQDWHRLYFEARKAACPRLFANE